MPGRPLAGLSVVEVTAGVAGALAAELLALLGADVVKVERPSGEDERASGRFVLANLGKRSVVVDDPTLARLVRRADVVIENVGLVVAEDNPRLVHLAITGVHPDWEFAGLPATEAVLQCLSGIASITGEPDEAPLRVGPDAVAQATAIYGAIGVLAALLQRARTGRGQRVDVAMVDAGINLCRTHFSRTAESGRFEPRPGNRQPAAQAEPTGVFPAAGGGPLDYVFAHASPEHLWRRLLAVIGREDLLTDPRFADGPTRLAHRAAVHAVVDEWTSQHSADDIMRIWGDAGIPVGATWTTHDLSTDPALLAAGQFADVAGHGRVPVLPYTFDGEGPAAPAAVPRLGAHTAAVLAELDVPRQDHAADLAAAGEPALEGIRVLDFTQALSGPIATQVLAFLGADVVRLQRPAAPSLGIERPWLKLDQLSMNKRSVVLDLKSADGRAAARRLVPRFDVVMENFAPGTMERLGFGWADLRALNPAVVFGRVKGFDPGSPYRDYRAFDNVAEAMGGACALTGRPDGEPMLPGPHLGDVGTGLVAALGVLALLYARLGTGHGGEVTCSMQATVATIFGRLAFAAGTARLRNGFGAPGAQDAPTGAYHCAGDGMNDYCYLTATDDRQWHALADVLGRPDLVTDPRFATAAARWANRAELDVEIERWTRTHDKRAAAHLLAAAGIEAAPILDTRELMDDPVLRRLGVFTRVPHPAHGEVFHVHWPIRMGDSFVAMRPAPTPGQHNAEVLADVLL